MRINLIVIRVSDIERSACFYQALGLVLIREKHGSGPEHYSADLEGTIFELYPRSDPEGTSQVRLGLTVNQLDRVVSACLTAGARLVAPPKESPWGRRAVIEDLDGHKIELTEGTKRS
jgi:lactoylglutathione lyase